ncbi:uncharacterized protein LOC107303686 [Oryza brachyantha]|uniref:uncharacterized protein LOC107303686 n=1 Tax=Oryza brachyantha TaxID=4533 RepID=UPI0007760BE8|nr:uncharacterized protein LOC107303686 [Oryza brachyantha]
MQMDQSPSVEFMEAAGDASALDPKLAPLLLFRHGDATFLYSVPARAPLPRRAADMDDMMRGHRWWTTAQGWLLMARRGSPDTFLWDPFTGRRVALPPDHDGTVLADGRHRRCLLSRRPPTDDPTCVVAVVVHPADMVLWYSRPGDQRWVKHHHQFLQPGTHLPEHPFSVISSLCRLTAIGDGNLYADLGEHFFGVLEFSPEPVFTLTAVSGGDDRRQGVYAFRTHSFVESNGELHCVCLYHPADCDRVVERVSVYKLSTGTGTAAQQEQRPRPAWVKVDSLGGRAFFVEMDSFGASLDARGGLKGNCIYYSGLNGKVLCVHDMERGTTAVIDPGASLPYHRSPQVLMPTI